jgi:hypothetical protein
VSALDSNRIIIKLARDLGLRGLDGPVTQITDHCVRRIQELTTGVQITSLAQLEQVVAGKLSLEFEELWCDEDIERLVHKYAVNLRDPVFASIRTHFNQDTFGTTFLRRKQSPSDSVGYVAVIDCRGAKAHRRFFTRWHEIAHLLTLPPKEGKPVNRSSIKKSPTEQLMDIIAGSVGFFDPVFRPSVELYVEQRGALTFEAVESLRSSQCPNASFQSTLIACVTRAPSPAIYLEAEMGYRKDELEKLDDSQLTLFATDEPEAKLRVVRVTANEQAKLVRLRFDRNMEVPEESIIARLFSDTAGSGGARDAAGVESLTLWKHSDGKALGTINVVVEARRLKDCVFALVRPT